MSPQMLRAGPCRPGTLLELHETFPGRGAHCSPRGFSLPPACWEKPWILPWALGLAPRSVKAVTSQGIRVNRQHMELV